LFIGGGGGKTQGNPIQEPDTRKEKSLKVEKTHEEVWDEGGKWSPTKRGGKTAVPNHREKGSLAWANDNVGNRPALGGGETWEGEKVRN